jgi:hypothetical protein
MWGRKDVSVDAASRGEVISLRDELEGVRADVRRLSEQLDHMSDSLSAVAIEVAAVGADLDAVQESGSGWSGGEGPAADPEAIRTHLLGRIQELGLSNPGSAVISDIVRASKGRRVNQGYCYREDYWPPAAVHPFGGDAVLMFFAEDQSTVWLPTTQGQWRRLDGEHAATILSPRV